MLTAGPAFGQDLDPPSWRGGPLTTYEQWDFSGGPSGGAPDVTPFYNPYGTPTWSTSGDATWSAVGPVTSTSYAARTNVWLLQNGGSGIADGINDARDFASTIGCKVVDFGITYYGDAPIVSIDPIPGDGDFTTTLDDIDTIPQPDGWTFARYDFTLYAQDSPSAEACEIASSASGATYLDGIVIDTQVVPEPTSLAVLALAGAMAAARRPRRRD
jgi:hypothetical protein